MTYTIEHMTVAEFEREFPPNSVNTKLSLWETIYEAFISQERQKFRLALKFWCADHCIMSGVFPPRFPMIDFQLTEKP